MNCKARNYNCSARPDQRLVDWFENRSADAAHPHPQFHWPGGPGLLEAVQDGTYRLDSSFSGGSIDVRILLLVEGEGRIRKLAIGLGAKVQLVERIEGADVAAPVLFFDKRLAAARVVGPLFEVLDTVDFAHWGVEFVDAVVDVRTPTLPVAGVTLDTNIEGVEVTPSVVVRR